MSWNYRLMRHANGEYTRYVIHEVYYNDDGSVRVWTEDGVAAVSDTPDEIHEVLAMMAEHLSDGVLDYETGKPIAECSGTGD